MANTMRPACAGASARSSTLPVQPVHLKLTQHVVPESPKDHHVRNAEALHRFIHTYIKNRTMLTYTQLPTTLSFLIILPSSGPFDSQPDHSQ